MDYWITGLLTGLLPSKLFLSLSRARALSLARARSLSKREIELEKERERMREREREAKFIGSDTRYELNERYELCDDSAFPL